MRIVSSRHAGLLRQELCARNECFAAQQKLAHVVSYGEPPVIIYEASACGRKHGNFIPASYRAILRRPGWSKRLLKIHTQGTTAFPRGDCFRRELDSSMSSDALLMNIFCYPGVTKRRELCLLLGTDPDHVPQFGFKPRVPLLNQMMERTEVDMEMGEILFEAKLTEGNFQIQRAELVEQYRDLKEIFEWRKLPRKGRDYISYQLLRSVLAAYALNYKFCLLLDARRPDLLEQWFEIVRCIRTCDLQTRCSVLTWQELAEVLPSGLQRFLNLKYGISHDQSIS
jgi:hypothetical protein